MQRTTMHKRLVTLVAVLACAGPAGCNSNDARDPGTSADTVRSEGQDHAGVTEEGTVTDRAAGIPDQVILEGTPGIAVDHPPLDRTLVSGATAPAGSEGFVLDEPQVSFGTGAPGSTDAAAVPPD